MTISMSWRVLAAMASIGSVSAALAAAPPLDCRRAHGPADKAICASPEDIALDQEVTALYNRGLASLGADDRAGLARKQIAYLRKRNGCAWASHHSAHPGAAVLECVSATLAERLRDLRVAVDRPGH